MEFEVLAGDVEAATDILDTYDGDIEQAIEACMQQEPETAALTGSDEPVTEDDRAFFLKCLRLAAGSE